MEDGKAGKGRGGGGDILGQTGEFSLSSTILSYISKSAAISSPLNSNTLLSYSNRRPFFLRGSFRRFYFDLNTAYLARKSLNRGSIYQPTYTNNLSLSHCLCRAVVLSCLIAIMAACRTHLRRRGTSPSSRTSSSLSSSATTSSPSSCDAGNLRILRDWRTVLLLF